MILVILGALWLIVLAPAFIKRWLERRPGESIDSFHHQLHLLERTGPKLVAPAYRLGATEPSEPVGVGPSGYPSVSSMPRRPNLVLLRPLGDEPTPSASIDPDDEVVDQSSGEHYRRVAPISVDEGRTSGVTSVPPLSPPSPEEMARLRARRRRGDILFGLLAAGVVTSLLGIAGSLHALWFVSMACGAALVLYISLMVFAASMASPAPTVAGRARGAHVRDRRSPRTASNAGFEVAAPSLDRQLALATAGYPGAWDDLFDEQTPSAPEVAAWSTQPAVDEDAYEPRRAAAGG